MYMLQVIEMEKEQLIYIQMPKIERNIVMKIDKEALSEEQRVD
jgi:hypothetical protein